jgi:hypothetical protein
MKPIGKFGRLFILLNRVFGAMCVVAGVSMILTAVAQAIARGMAAANFWQTFAIGVCIVVAGVLYLRAPLFRDKILKLQERDPLEELNRVERTMREEVDRKL